MIPADIEGKAVKVRIDGSYLAQALKACGGMVDFKLTNSYSPMLFTTDGYQLVVMPMMTSEANEQAKRDREAKVTEAEAKTEPTTTEPVTEPEAEAVAEAEAVIAEAKAEAEAEADKPKRKRRAKEPVAVA